MITFLFLSLQRFLCAFNLPFQRLDIAVVAGGMVNFRLAVGCLRRWSCCTLYHSCIIFVVTLLCFLLLLHTCAKVDDSLLIIFFTHNNNFKVSISIRIFRTADISFYFFLSILFISYQKYLSGQPCRTASAAPHRSHDVCGTSVY